jgi:hypothetical protein
MASPVLMLGGWGGGGGKPCPDAAGDIEPYPGAGSYGDLCPDAVRIELPVLIPEGDEKPLSGAEKDGEPCPDCGKDGDPCPDAGRDGCSVSRWRPQKVDKRMVLEHTHGLFIT